MNKDIKLIGLDLDGTSLNVTGTAFTDITKNVFEKARSKGIDIVIATGRPYHSLPQDIFALDMIEYVVTSNGAMVYDLVNDKIIQKRYIKSSVIESLVKIFKSNDCIIDVFVEGKAFISEKDYENIMNGVTNFRPKEYIKRTRTPVADIYEFMIDNKDRIENISINYMEIKNKTIMENILSEIEDITLTSSVPTNNEIGAKEVNKAKGLNDILKLKGLTYDNLMAVGDNPNDISMVKSAKIGVAMGNASQKLKDVADYITLTNKEDGVAKAIEKLVL